jgi:hypothetical protein
MAMCKDRIIPVGHLDTLLIASLPLLLGRDPVSACYWGPATFDNSLSWRPVVCDNVFFGRITFSFDTTNDDIVWLHCTNRKWRNI